MEGHGELQNLNDFAAVNRGILKNGPVAHAIWQNLLRKTGP